ncbi:hypothetical protein [Pseudomonas aeruginosa]|uniref:hypothetical protein n=1 Tax=Pseudomonas aeruginosa TaxID=287 RepID=UPI000A55A02E|nr:hypothetical protein [Pseudomonas aeruginosa]MEE4319124.1 hypothetical protein [Pseudomonas aeruginosa]HBN9584465.1 hypothetical protein [Pseudomonas aeruginosa]HCA7898417.1 hypothetical protein [Pseudomonas aeruginosa]HCF6878588.1 hypothetical protein [Pseudomonas aeruginosa]
MHTIQTDIVTDEIISDIFARDCALWLTTTALEAGIEFDSLLDLIDGPWRAVFVESTSGAFGQTLAERASATLSSNQSSGFSHLIASDPLSLTLQRHSKPIFFLNGRTDLTGLESSTLSTRSSDRRRLNMTARLKDLEPRRVIIVGDHPALAIEDLADLWQDEFRSLISIVSTDADATAASTDKFEQQTSLKLIHWLTLTTEQFTKQVKARLENLTEKSNLLVNVKLPGSVSIEVDLRAAEFAEAPLQDLCDFIRVSDTLPLAAEDLREDEFQSFFSRQGSAWRNFAAGLPWISDPEPQKKLLKGLHNQLAEAPGSVKVFSIVSEAGAGGTTQARTLAFTAARAGFPALVVKQESPLPSILELTGFFFRAVAEISKRALEAGLADVGEPVWVLVLDVQHADKATDELERLCGEFARSGRKVAIIKVTPPNRPVDLPKSIHSQELAYIRHSLESDQVSHLGKHLNLFLRRFGKEKTDDEWTKFWRAHSPELNSGIASFWITLEFWLGGFLDIGESVQNWVIQQFKSLPTNEIQHAIMEIASLAIERKPTPEKLLKPLTSPQYPWSYALEEAKSDSPGLGLMEGESFPGGRVWIVAHDLLARYLINGIWNDRLLCEKLGLPLYEDPIALRLAMISNLAMRTTMGDAAARPFAVALAMNILKLDESSGNAEFFKHWRTALHILEKVPPEVTLSSRSFNHHLAISKRRVTQGDLFQIEENEKKTLLKEAAESVEFALDNIAPTPDDETNLALLNTLALTYQDLAELERKNGDPTRLNELLEKCDEVTNRALKENPNSPYVLETVAKNLLRQGMTGEASGERIESAAKALSFVFQASQLDSAYTRRMKLGQLAAQALKILRDDNAISKIDSLCNQGIPYGYIAKAWCSLPISTAEASLLLDEIDAELAEPAIKILRSSPSRDWLLVRILYDLVVIAEPTNFQEQLHLLDELSSTKGYQLSLQQVLERAILLFIAGQHKQGSEEFRWLRPRVKESQTSVFVPNRLRWLLGPDRLTKAVCTGQVVDSAASARGMAKVKELGNIWAPYNPQEFGKRRMGSNEHFKCIVTFGAMGPFLKPVEASHR